jgi:hypothetical protein
MEDQFDYAGQEFSGINTRMRDLEEKQRILKDRVLLIGQNLIEMKEKNTEDLLEMKKDIENIKQKLERLQSFFETASAEFSKFARKEDLDILAKQARMFQPLEKLKKS